jgi:RNA recognition motif-containing protein
MGKKLYVGNLSYNTRDEGLSEAFSKVGEVVSASVISDRETGKSRGFGFVEMATDEDAAKAVETLNNSQLDGRNIVVNEARPKSEDRGDRGGRGGGGRGGSRGGGGYGRR